MRVQIHVKAFKNILKISFCLVFLFGSLAFSQTRARSEITIPDIPGYFTLKCDFHTHTVFSDGSVWPTIRVEEAWREGLDAIALSDHIEYLPHKNEIPVNHNAPYEIAKGQAEKYGIILIKGAEITRPMPPGHFNAIFLTDINPLDTELYENAFKAAIEQDAFIFWNHPGWRQPDEIPMWYPEHSVLLNNDWIHGIEIVNTRSYYPLAHQWCLDKKLTMLGNSDIHNPINMDYELHKGEHRPMTLVFAKETNADAIKEALFLRRTAVYSGNLVIGEEQFLRPLFEESIEILKSDVTIHGETWIFVPIRNRSSIPYEIIPDGEVDNLSANEVTLYGNRTVMMKIKGNSIGVSGTKMVSLPFKIKNLLIAPDTGLSIEININATFIPVEE